MLNWIRHKLRQYFLAGLLTLIPLIGTIWILKMIVMWSQDFFLGLLPEQWRPHALFGSDIPGIGLAVAIVIIPIVGMITQSFLTRQFVRAGEWVMARIPVARTFYSGIQRLLQLVLGDTNSKMNRVVIVTYPYPGSKAYGFVTGETSLPDANGVPVKHLRIFIPTTPNPTSGFLLLIPERDTMPSNIPIDQVSKIIVSGGLM